MSYFAITAPRPQRLAGWAALKLSSWEQQALGEAPPSLLLAAAWVLRHARDKGLSGEEDGAWARSSLHQSALQAGPPQADQGNCANSRVSLVHFRMSFGLHNPAREHRLHPSPGLGTSFPDTLAELS